MAFWIWLMHDMILEQKEKQNILIKQPAIATEEVKSVSKNKVSTKPKAAFTPKIKKNNDKEYIIHDATVTAYDLSVQSCGKPIGSRGYGLTASGYDISKKSREEAKTIAVDPRVIPLGKKVEITFKEPHMQKYNGIYVARDTGGAIKGNKIDLFMGDFRSNEPAKEAINFGVQKATLKVFI